MAINEVLEENPHSMVIDYSKNQYQNPRNNQKNKTNTSILYSILPILTISVSVGLFILWIFLFLAGFLLSPPVFFGILIIITAYMIRERLITLKKNKDTQKKSEK
jgi:hypothetical protein